LGEDVAAAVGGLQCAVGGGPGQVIVAEFDHQLRREGVEVGELPAGGGVLVAIAFGVGGDRGGQ
jgi:hypothetical protein